MNKNAIFLDDLRMSVDVLNYIQNKEYSEDKWLVVRSYDDFVIMILALWNETIGLPELISFDHDLGIEHIKYYFDNGGHESPPDPLKANFTERTGYDCAKWLVNFCIDNNAKLPRYKVHSKNVSGKENILGILGNFKKHQENG